MTMVMIIIRTLLMDALQLSHQHPCMRSFIAIAKVCSVLGCTSLPQSLVNALSMEPPPRLGVQALAAHSLNTNQQAEQHLRQETSSILNLLGVTNGMLHWRQGYTA